MTRFERVRPNQEIQKLKEWSGARAAQLKLFVGHLESAFHSSLAAQVAQSSKREFSEFVPKIVDQDITTEIEFREARIFWEPPRGLRDFLFYELQISSTSNFSNFDVFVTSDPLFVFPNLLDGRTYYIRIRVVTKNQLFGPWTNNITVTTPFSQSYGLFDGTEFLVPVSNIGGAFQTLFSRDYTAIGGKTYYSIDYEIEIQTTQFEDKNLEWADVEFQWNLDGNQVGQNFLVTTYGVTDTTFYLGSNLEAITADVGSFPSDHLLLPGPFKLARRGTFVQKFSTITSGSHTITLVGRVINNHPTPNDWVFNAGATQARYGRPAFVTLKNFNIFEALVS